MKQEFLKFYPHPELSLLALFLFIGVFVGMLFWIYRRNSNKLYNKLSNLPLED